MNNHESACLPLRQRCSGTFGRVDSSPNWIDPRWFCGKPGCRSSSMWDFDVARSVDRPRRRPASKGNGWKCIFRWASVELFKIMNELRIEWLPKSHFAGGSMVSHRPSTTRWANELFRKTKKLALKLPTEGNLHYASDYGMQIGPDMERWRTNNSHLEIETT